MEKVLYKWRVFFGVLLLVWFAVGIFNIIQVAHHHPLDHALNAIFQLFCAVAILVYYPRRNDRPVTLDISSKEVTSENAELRAKS